MLKVLVSFGVVAAAGREIIHQGDNKLHTRRASGAKVDLDEEGTTSFKKVPAGADGTSTLQRDPKLTWITMPSDPKLRSSFVSEMDPKVPLVPKVDPKQFTGFGDCEGSEIKQVISQEPDVTLNVDQIHALLDWSADPKLQKLLVRGFISTDVQWTCPHSNTYPMGKLVGMRLTADPKQEPHVEIEYPDGTSDSEKAYVTLSHIAQACRHAIENHDHDLIMNFGEIAMNPKTVPVLLHKLVDEQTTATIILGVEKAK